MDVDVRLEMLTFLHIWFGALDYGWPVVFIHMNLLG